MGPQLVFREAGPADIPLLRMLAERIWRSSYVELLTAAQVDYMLGWMYGATTITAEMAEGVSWQVAERAGAPVGYLSVAVHGGVAELHKLYLAPELHGQGLGQAMLGQARRLARRAGAAELRLRVNKGNVRAQKSYERAGFAKVAELTADIGGGFVMDDFVFALPLGGAAPLVKICGLSTGDTMEAALAAGADQVGLVFFPRSPRHVTLDRAQTLAAQARGRAAVVALVVDADDALIDAVMAAARPDWLQLHGRESPARTAALRARADRPVMKALGLATMADLASGTPYRSVADRLLFDAKPPAGAMLPGGNGQPFDWAILRDAPPGYMLSGGLTPGNVAEALRISGTTAVDVSSGVETAPGRKDPDRITAFVRAVKGGGADAMSPRSPVMVDADPLTTRGV